MIVEQNMVCNHCSLGCLHCPYASTEGEDYFPRQESISSEEDRVIHILTGGEPLESEAFGKWIESLLHEEAFFRIATAGFIPVHHWAKRLRGISHFLGFNVGTDLLTSRCSIDVKRREVWKRNWSLLRQEPGTWLTITLGEHVSPYDASRLVEYLRPHTVLMNSEWPIPVNETNEIKAINEKVDYLYGYNLLR